MEVSLPKEGRTLADKLKLQWTLKTEAILIDFIY